MGTVCVLDEFSIKYIKRTAVGKETPPFIELSLTYTFTKLSTTIPADSKSQLRQVLDKLRYYTSVISYK